jgi:serine/threonine-protein kinase HipA
MPVNQKRFSFDSFPPFFDGLLPEGFQLDGLLKFGKIDRNDLFSQLMAVGSDLVGNVTIEEITA